jgi:MbtH protein
VINPFEDADGVFVVLLNDEEQHCIWPAALDRPEGWIVVHARDTREACLDYVEQYWTDMRPRSLVRAMNATH